MNMRFKRAAAAMLAAAAMTAAVPAAGPAVDAADTAIVVIGDSASSGRTLADQAKSYAALTGDYYQVEVLNLAKDSCTTEELLLTLDDPAVQAQLAQAKVICFTAGLQDLTGAFKEELQSFQKQTGLEDGSVDELFTLPRDTVSMTDEELMTEANKLADLLRSNRDSCAENIGKIGEKLSAYTNAKIVCFNVYNPLSKIEQYDSLSANRTMAYNILMNPAKSVLTKYVNPAYQQLADTYGFTVVDVYTQFDGLAYKYTGLNTMDFEPNEEGHQWMSGQVITALSGVLPEPSGELALGDVDGSGAVNANDATKVLAAAAKVGTSGTTGLTAAEEKAADVNKDGAINAKDATAILRYAAAVGNGESVSISDFTS